MFDVKFDQIVSIGSACDCAMLLNDVGLRMASGPLDWVLGPTFEQRIGLLERRFDGFMVRENIVWKESGRHDRASDIYRDMSLGYVFIHDFPKGEALDNSFPGVRDKYARRINRLLKRLDEGWTTCFVWRSLEAPVSDESCAAAVAALRRAFPKADCRILLFENDVTAPKGRLAFASVADGACVRAKGFFAVPDSPDPMGDRSIQWKVLRKLRCSPALARQRHRHTCLRGLVRFLSLWHLTREGRKLACKRWTQKLFHKNGSVGW